MPLPEQMQQLKDKIAELEHAIESDKSSERRITSDMLADLEKVMEVADQKKAKLGRELRFANRW